MFVPEWDIVYLYHVDRFEYCVIKKPEPIPGEKTPMVREGCTVIEDGRWYYWKLLEPVSYQKWMLDKRWSDKLAHNPNEVVKCRLNRGNPGVIAAPVFKATYDNNWIDLSPRIVPDYVSDEMLGDLSVAHLQLCDELQEGKPLLKVS